MSHSLTKKIQQLPAKQSRPGSSCSFPKQITLSIISSKPWDLSHIVVVLVHHAYSSARDTRQVTFVMQCNIFFKTSWRKNKLVSEHKGNFQLFRWNFSYKLFLQTLRTLTEISGFSTLNRDLRISVPDISSQIVVCYVYFWIKEFFTSRRTNQLSYPIYWIL